MLVNPVPDRVQIPSITCIIPTTYNPGPKRRNPSDSRIRCNARHRHRHRHIPTSLGSQRGSRLDRDPCNLVGGTDQTRLDQKEHTNDETALGLLDGKLS